MPTPDHIAIIMDGNGRWAEARKRPRSMGHQAGIRAAKQLVKNCAERNITTLTLFAFSSENWQRPAAEVRRLMDLFLRSLHREVDELDSNGVRLSFIGDRSRLSPELIEGMDRVEKRTAGNSRLRLVIAINYGGHWDITQAAAKLCRRTADGELDPDEITEETVRAELCLFEEGDPDLLIRTGGEKRISNFMLWQMAYTELYFSDVLWPDFDAAELDRAIEDYAHRQRRFGRLAEQLSRTRSA
ncbi:MAG: polyprenyl diphosphate synthase [Xanthomonadales bacterium]|nr:polyprenyl diphosphate synthase [Xanthomonadales bacterium]